MKNRRTATPSAMAEPIQTLKEIDEEIARLKERAASIVKAEKAGVIARMKDAIGYYSLTAADLGFGPAAKSPKTGKTVAVARAAKPAGTPLPAAATASADVAAKPPRAGAGKVKYKDDAGHTWSGFGPKPRWLAEALSAGKTLEDMAA